MHLFFMVLVLTCGISPSLQLQAGQSNGSSQPAVIPLTNKDVREMLQAGLSSEVVIAKIKSSKCSFDTSPSVLKELKTEGIEDGVILAMVQAPVELHAPAQTQPAAKTAVITCYMAKNIPAYPSPEVSTAVANPNCGDTVSVLDYHDGWVKIQTADGTIGWIVQYFLPKEFQHIKPTPVSEGNTSVTPTGSSTLSANMLRAVAWRGVPWVTTSYYQQQGSASTQCAGSGTWFGNFWQANASCTTQYTPAQTVPFNWQHYTIYNLVETSDSWIVLGCTRNWAFSRCSYLIPGSLFPFENKKGKISIRGHKAGKDNEQTLDLDIISTQPKSSR